MTPLHATILGIVEGLTEFLPVSSTGHLILAAHAMGYIGGEMNAFEVVIQAGALLAVIWLYRERVGELWAGAFTPHPRGRALLLRLTVAFVPAGILGFFAHDWISEHLFGPRPVALALVAGGILILLVARWQRGRAGSEPIRTIDDFSLRAALLIGLAQCLSLWPGTSRAMATMVAAILLGASPVAAAEFSFLLALPTLGMATLYSLLKNFHDLTGPALGGPAPLLIGLTASALVAALAIKGFLRFVTNRGLAVFGWYRIALGAAVVLLLWHHPGAGTP